MSVNIVNTLFNCIGLLTSQAFIGAKRIRAPFPPPRLSELRKVEAEAHAVDTSSEIDRLVFKICAFRD
ncbi:hypothetical protein D3C87_1326890 [compost metagenome]